MGDPVCTSDGGYLEKKSRFAEPEIFLGFEIDLDFQKSGCRLKGWQLVKFKTTILPWGTLYVLQTEEVTIRQHLEILATWRCRIVAVELSTFWTVKSIKYIPGHISQWCNVCFKKTGFLKQTLAARDLPETCHGGFSTKKTKLMIFPVLKCSNYS